MTTCIRCSATWTGLRMEHCTATSRVGVTLWPATKAGADFHTSPFESTPHGARIGADLVADQFGSEPLLVEVDGPADIDALESGFRPLPTALLSMVTSVLGGGHDAKIGGVIVRAVAVDMVNLNILPEGAHYEAMLVTLDVLGGSGPTKPDVSGSVEQAGRLFGGRFLVGAERPHAPSIRTKPSGLTGVAPSSLAGGSGDFPLAINANDVHDLTIQWSCHQTFTGASAGDMHRTGDHAVNEGPNRRRCLTSAEMREKGMRRNERGIWTTGKATEAWWEQ